MSYPTSSYNSARTDDRLRHFDPPVVPGKLLGTLMILIGLCFLTMPGVFVLEAYWAQYDLTRQRIASLTKPVSQGEHRREIPAAVPTMPKAFPQTRIGIRSIGLDALVVPGVSESDLSRGPGHVPGTANPGEKGNCCIAAHRNLWFRKLDQVSLGDMVRLNANGTEYAYRVTDKFTVKPTDLYVLDPTAEPTLTLITCKPGGRSKGRVIVRAELAVMNY